jgi:hypothetical protein
MSYENPKPKGKRPTGVPHKFPKIWKSDSPYEDVEKEIEKLKSSSSVVTSDSQEITTTPTPPPTIVNINISDSVIQNSEITGVKNETIVDEECSDDDIDESEYLQSKLHKKIATMGVMGEQDLPWIREKLELPPGGDIGEPLVFPTLPEIVDGFKELGKASMITIGEDIVLDEDDILEVGTHATTMRIATEASEPHPPHVLPTHRNIFLEAKLLRRAYMSIIITSFVGIAVIWKFWGFFKEWFIGIFGWDRILYAAVIWIMITLISIRALTHGVHNFSVEDLQ